MSESPDPKDPLGLKRAGRLAASGISVGAQMGLAAIPFVGGPLATVVAELELRHLGLRVERWIQELRAAIDRVEHAKVDHAFLATPEFTDIVIADIEAARRTNDGEKLRLLASVLAGATSVERPTELDIEGLLVTIRDLPPAAINLVLSIHRQAGQTPHSYLQGYYPPTDFPDGDFVMNRLVAAGFAREFNVVGGMTFQQPGWQLTSTWYRLVELVKTGGWEPPG